MSLNVIGLRRSEEITEEDRRQVREAFDPTYRSDLNIRAALRAMDDRTEWGWAAARFRDFVRRVVFAQPPTSAGFARCEEGIQPQTIEKLG